MAIGDVTAVGDGIHCLDTGMYETPAYGSVYVLEAERPAVVDTGIGVHPERVLDACRSVGVDPGDLAVIAPTHVHLDHAGGAGALTEACPTATVVVHEAGAPHLSDPSRLVEGTRRAVGDEWSFYVEPTPVPTDRIRTLTDGDVVDLGDRALEVRHAPGHAPHQVVFHDSDAATAFTGDAAGIYVPALDEIRPTTPPPNFDLEAALVDLETLADLGPERLCYGHFGPAPTTDRLDEAAKVLGDWVAEVAAAREASPQTDVQELARGFYGRDDLATVWGERRARAHYDLNTAGVVRYLGTREA